MVKYWDHYSTNSLTPEEDVKTILVSYGRVVAVDDVYIYLVHEEVWEDNDLVEQKVDAIVKSTIIEMIEFEQISHSNKWGLRDKYC